jgi:predicted nucleic acid-binding protein
MTEYLLDTNVVSETARQRPARRVLSWLSRRKRLAVSSVTWFELHRGIENLPKSRKRTFLEDWLDQWEKSGLEVVPFEKDAATEAARLEAEARAVGRSIDVRDLFVLATAAAFGLGVATRNASHFDGFGVVVLDPFIPGEDELP